MAKARSTTTGASVRARAAAKPRSAKATARPVSKSAVKPHKRHRLLGFLATMFALLALAGAAARALPADLQELPFAAIGNIRSSTRPIHSPKPRRTPWPQPPPTPAMPTRAS